MLTTPASATSVASKPALPVEVDIATAGEAFGLVNEVVRRGLLTLRLTRRQQRELFTRRSPGTGSRSSGDHLRLLR